MEMMTTGEAARRLGVGLTTVKRWVQLGLLRAIRTPGGHWRIPAGEVERLLAAMGADSNRVTVRVLVIEDDPNTCDLIREWLRHDGTMNIEAECMHDGLSGLLHLGRMMPDLLVLDIGLPGMNGLEILQRIHAVPEFSGMRVIVATGKRNRSLLSGRIAKLRPDAILDKPFDEDSFLSTVRKVLDMESGGAQAGRERA